MKILVTCRALILIALISFGSALAQAAGQGQDQPAGQNQTQGQTESSGQSQAQEPGQAEAQDQEAEPALTEERTPVPILINGEITTLAFSTEAARSNYLRGGVALGTIYDDNVLSTPSNPTGDFSYSVLPYIALDQVRSRMHWNLNYAVGLGVNQKLSQRNQAAQNFGGQLGYRLSPHVDLLLQDHFTMTNNFRDPLLGSAGVPGSGAIQQPNQTVITPVAKQISNLGSVALNYQFTAGDMVGGSGTSYESRFSDVPAGATGLLDTSSQQADGYYTHRLSPRYWIGGDYEFQRFSFTPGFEEARVHRFLLFNTIYFQRRMTLSIFGGPEYSDLESLNVTPVVNPPVISVISVPASQKTWTGAGGMVFNWQGEHTSVQAGASRKVNDGGGVLGAVELTSATLGVRRRLTRYATLIVGGLYGDSRALGHFATATDTIRSASGTAAMEHQLGRHFVLNYGYARDYQHQTSSVLPPTNVDHNRGWVSIAYSFEKPFGK